MVWGISSDSAKDGEAGTLAIEIPVITHLWLSVLSEI